MNDAKKKELLNKLQAYRQAFALQLPEKLQGIEDSWHSLVEEQWSAKTLSNMHRMVHSLAGSSGTFGLPQVGEVAYTLETILVVISKGGNIATEQQRQEVRQRLDALSAVIHESLKQGGDTADELPQQTLTTVSFNSSVANKRIYIVEDDADLAKSLADHVSYFGYSVQTFATLAAFKQALQQNEPNVILLDIELPDGDGAQVLAEIQKDRTSKLLVVFLSVHGDLQTRLRAVEAGSHAFCPKPVNLSLLIDILDRLTSSQDPEPYRIVIVDDSKSLAEYYAMVLQNIGMKTCVVTDPLQTMEALETFQPDLLLLDLYMPQCSGLALAAAIRQQESFISVPILFLSGETDVDKQLSAVSAGGDGFLTKPIKPEHLIRAVSARVERYRKLRSLMTRDSLTGLFNHTRTKEHIDIELDRAKRNSTVVAFAMVDIDKFKLVNDTYGHTTGDRVIKSLSRLLKQRLRKTDIVGRYGGEEFAVILPDTTEIMARDILDQLRHDFGKVAHQHEKGAFNSTFSCGIAAFPEYVDGLSLNNAADKALYVAKNNGRNRVEMASIC